MCTSALPVSLFHFHLLSLASFSSSIFIGLFTHYLLLIYSFFFFPLFTALSFVHPTLFLKGCLCCAEAAFSLQNWGVCKPKPVLKLAACKDGALTLKILFLILASALYLCEGHWISKVRMCRASLQFGHSSLLQSFEVSCYWLNSHLALEYSVWFADRWLLLCSLAFPGKAWRW